MSYIAHTHHLLRYNLMDEAMRIVSFFRFLSIATITTISLCNGNLDVPCKQNERQALLMFKKDLEYPSNRLLSWVGEGDCCNWTGVVCNNLTGHVRELHLGNYYSDEYLNYSLYQENSLGGKVTNTLPSMLVELHMSGCELNQIPVGVANMTRLKVVNLRWNIIWGTIPQWLYTCSNFESLSLYLILLRGEISSSIGNLTAIVYFDLSANQIDGKMPNSLGNLCPILASLGNLSFLDEASISENHFNRTLPKTTGQLKMKQGRVRNKVQEKRKQFVKRREVESNNENQTLSSKEKCELALEGADSQEHSDKIAMLVDDEELELRELQGSPNALGFSEHFTTNGDHACSLFKVLLSQGGESLYSGRRTLVNHKHWGIIRLKGDYLCICVHDFRSRSDAWIMKEYEGDRIFGAFFILLPCWDLGILLSLGCLTYATFGVFKERRNGSFEGGMPKLLGYIYLLDHGGEDVAVSYEVSVYSLKANSWKRIQNVPCCGSSLYLNNNVVLNGALSSKQLDNEYQNKILIIDPASEKYHEFPIPVNLDVMENHQCISVYNFIKSQRDAWVMKEYGVTESWSLLYSIDELGLGAYRSKPWAVSKNGKGSFEGGVRRL
ncbi:unnamed protein product [Prunus armeniaca]